MEEEKAVKILTKKLVENSGRTIVFNQSHKDKLVKNTDLVYIVGDSKILDYERDYKKYFSQGNQFGILPDMKLKSYEGPSIEEALRGIIPDEANYLFASTPIRWNDYHLGMNVVPYAILGDKECTAIKKMFYKSDDLEVREAIESLKIENFFGLYDLYSTKKIFTLYRFIDDLFQNPRISGAFTKDPVSHNHIDRLENAIKQDHDLNLINSLLKRLDAKYGTFSVYAKVCTEELDSMMKHLNKHLDFFSFVLDLPSDEQDIETNRLLLKHYGPLLNMDTIILKEYSQGQFFKEYFEILEEDQKENIVRLLKNYSPNDPGYDSFLFSLGFKEVMNLSDYTLWYENDSEKFIASFQEESREKKIAILENLFETKITNERVIDWLNENESRLMRETVMS